MIDIATRPPRGVTHRLSSVTVVDLTGEAVTVRDANGERHTVPLDTLVDSDAERELRRRRRRRGNLFDLFTLPWLHR